MKSSEIYAMHLKRMWPERHNRRVVVFANGHVYGVYERRKSIRQNLSAQRHFRARGD
jgi:hypothetical protein